MHLLLVKILVAKLLRQQLFLYVRSCEKVSEISNSNLLKYLSGFTDKSGMKYSKYNLEFFGLCRKCKVK